MSKNMAAIIGNIGGAIAAGISYAKWHSVGYAILHFLCGWIYVVYRIASR